MLLNKLYTIRHLENSPDNSVIAAQIEIDSVHPLFAGHFPGNPVLPGVCTVQIIREILEECLHKPVIITRAKVIKYLGLVNPVSMPLLDFSLHLHQFSENGFSCSAVVSFEGTGVCSFKGDFGDFPGSG
jgi:3-hydroxyacyl-[acyl-carrier-protein] dehydratase